MAKFTKTQQYLLDQILKNLSVWWNPRAEEPVAQFTVRLHNRFQREAATQLGKKKILVAEGNFYYSHLDHLNATNLLWETLGVDLWEKCRENILQDIADEEEGHPDMPERVTSMPAYRLELFREITQKPDLTEETALEIENNRIANNWRIKQTRLDELYAKLAAVTTAITKRENS